MQKFKIDVIEHLTRHRLYEIEALDAAEAFNRFFRDNDGVSIDDYTEGSVSDVEYNIIEIK